MRWKKKYTGIVAVALIALAALYFSGNLPFSITGLEPYYNWACTYDATGKVDCTGTAISNFASAYGCSNAYDASQQGWCAMLGINNIGSTVASKTGIAVSSQQEDELYSSMTIVSGCRFGWTSGGWPESNTRNTLSGASRLTDIGCRNYYKGSATCPMVCDSYYNCNTNPSERNQVIVLFLNGRTTAGECKITMRMTPTPATTTTTIPSLPPVPTLPDIQAYIASIISAIINWIKSLFWTFQVLTTAPSYKAGDVASFSVSIPLSAIDSDYSDGTYQRRYALWFVTDASQNVKANGAWEEVTNAYAKSVQLTAPSAGEYYFVALVNQYDYVATGGTWNIPQPVTMAKEAVKFTTYTLSPPAPTPLPDIAQFLSNLLASLISWLRGLFGG